MHAFTKIIVMVTALLLSLFPAFADNQNKVDFFADNAPRWWLYYTKKYEALYFDRSSYHKEGSNIIIDVFSFPEVDIQEKNYLIVKYTQKIDCNAPREIRFQNVTYYGDDEFNHSLIYIDMRNLSYDFNGGYIIPGHIKGEDADEAGADFLCRIEGAKSPYPLHLDPLLFENLYNGLATSKDGSIYILDEKQISRINTVFKDKPALEQHANYLKVAPKIESPVNIAELMENIKHVPDIPDMIPEQYKQFTLPPENPDWINADKDESLQIDQSSLQHEKNYVSYWQKDYVSYWQKMGDEDNGHPEEQTSTYSYNQIDCRTAYVKEIISFAMRGTTDLPRPDHYFGVMIHLNAAWSSENDAARPVYEKIRALVCP